MWFRVLQILSIVFIAIVFLCLIACLFWMYIPVPSQRGMDMVIFESPIKSEELSKFVIEDWNRYDKMSSMERGLYSDVPGDIVVNYDTYMGFKNIIEYPNIPNPFYNYENEWYFPSTEKEVYIDVMGDREGNINWLQLRTAYKIEDFSIRYYVYIRSDDFETLDDWDGIDTYVVKEEVSYQELSNGLNIKVVRKERQTNNVITLKWFYGNIFCTVDILGEEPLDVLEERFEKVCSILEEYDYEK